MSEDETVDEQLLRLFDERFVAVANDVLQRWHVKDRRNWIDDLRNHAWLTLQAEINEGCEDWPETVGDNWICQRASWRMRDYAPKILDLAPGSKQADDGGRNTDAALYADVGQSIEIECGPPEREGDPITDAPCFDDVAAGLKSSDILDPLSEQEQRICKKLSEGYSQLEVAEDEGLTQGRVSQIRQNIREKLESH